MRGKHMRLIDWKIVACTAVGLALAMSISSLVLWGGALSSDGALAQIGRVPSMLAMVAAGVAVLVWSLACPRSLRAFLLRVAPPVLAACLVLLGVLSVRGVSVSLFAGVVPLIGAFLLTLSWISFAAARGSEDGLLGLIMGWALAFPLRSLLELPGGVAVRIAVAVVYAAGSWALLLLCYRLTKGLPFGEVCDFRESQESYRHALSSLWPSALVGAAFAVIAGVIRTLSALFGLESFVNWASFVGGIASAVVLSCIWRSRTVRFSVPWMLRMLFPMLVFALCLLPFAAQVLLLPLVAVMYVLFGFFSLCLEVLCVQVANDYGVDPVFCSSFQIGVMTFGQLVGMLLGDSIAYMSDALGQSCSLSALVSLGVLSLALYMAYVRGSARDDSRCIELVSLSREGALGYGEEEPGCAATGCEDDEQPLSADAAFAAQKTTAQAAASGVSDVLQAKCDLVAKQYYLSQRELEVMRLIVRGYTISSIAEELFITDNTVKTHTRRLYAKLGVHKKQELFDIVTAC